MYTLFRRVLVHLGQDKPPLVYIELQTKLLYSSQAVSGHESSVSSP